MTKPTNVIEALARVSASVGAIEKLRRPKSGPSYDYRGIEDVLNSLHAPLRDNGVVIVPRVSRADIVDRPNYGKEGGLEAQMLVEYDIYGPGGPSDKITASVFATGIDTGDKGAGKAMSYAYKTLAFQLLCIPTDVVEDNESNPLVRTGQVPEDFYGWNSKKAHDEWWQVQSERLKALSDAARDLAIGKLNDAGLFDGRKPREGCPPFAEVHREEIEYIIDGAEMAARGGLHSPHARALMIEALGVDDPEGADVEQWMWELAEVEDLDAHKWETTLRAAKVKRVDALDRAFHIAERLGLPTPDGINDIHGPVAVELRVSLLKQEPPF